jgi:hypothetical protein
MVFWLEYSEFGGLVGLVALLALVCVVAGQVHSGCFEYI